MLGQASLKTMEMITTLTEVEVVLNSRPLTHSSSDINDMPPPTPSTPSHFLCAYRLLNLPDTHGKQMRQEDDEEYVPSIYSTKTSLKRRAEYHEKPIASLWVRWKKEYIVNLRQIHSHNKTSIVQESQIKASDIVLVHDNLPRSQWKLAVVSEVLKGCDGIVRSAKLRTSKENELRQPIEKLYPLKVSEEKNKKLTNITEQNMGESQKPSLRRSTRTAAQQAKLKIASISSDE